MRIIAELKQFQHFTFTDKNNKGTVECKKQSLILTEYLSRLLKICLL